LKNIAAIEKPAVIVRILTHQASQPHCRRH